MLQLAEYERERQRLEDAVALHQLAEEANDEATRVEAKDRGPRKRSRRREAGVDPRC